MTNRGQTRASVWCVLDRVGPSLASSFRNDQNPLYPQGQRGWKWDARDTRTHPSCAPFENTLAEKFGHRTPVVNTTRMRGTSAMTYVPCELTSLFPTIESNLLTRFRELTSPLCYLNELHVDLTSETNYFAIWWRNRDLSIRHRHDVRRFDCVYGLCRLVYL